MEEQTPKPDVTAWLADATGDDPGHVAAELELGERRRAFVVNELIEAGLIGASLLDAVLRLTGIEERQARQLVAAHETQAEPEQIEVPKRDERLAENEILFRQLNEQIAKVGRQESAPDRIELVCECSDRGCANTLTMPFSEYEWLRQHPRRFTVLPGHEAPAVEDVVERREGYVVVEKHEETHQQVEAADPRS